MNTKRLKSLVGRITPNGVLSKMTAHRTVIFTLHRVLSASAYQRQRFARSITMTDIGLETLLGNMRKHFEIVPLSYLYQSNRPNQCQSVRPKAILTFDDGWRDNYDVAYPILKATQTPATIFLSTNFISSPLGFWWQHLGEMLAYAKEEGQLRTSIKYHLRRLLPNSRALEIDCFEHPDQCIELIKQLHYDETLHIVTSLAEVTQIPLEPHGLTWAQCEEMSQHGISFGSHTLSHPRLSLLTTEQQHHELATSRKILEDSNLNYINAICFPYGDYNEHTLTQAAEIYDFGLTTDTGTLSAKRQGHNSYQLPRINLCQGLAQDIGRFHFRLLTACMKVA